MEKILSPLQQGVKLIGIGKHGSKKLPGELIIEIKEELKHGKAEALLIGAFFGALMMKDIEPGYYVLEEYLGKGSLTEASKLWDSLCADAPVRLKRIGVKLINKQTLTVAEATELGAFLFSDEPGESFRGMAVSILRIRYESDEEYQGLYTAIQHSVIHHTIEFNREPVIQLAEPFDGVEHSYMITPILAYELQKQGYHVVVSCGRTAGPKITLNAWDLYTGLHAEFLTTRTGLINDKPKFGWALDQKIVYPALDKWVEKRKIIMKRPFLSTLEKVMNPFKANILITSVFHIPYLEKMVALGGMAGFDGIIVLKRGLEGSLAPSLAKATGILCAAKMPDGTIVTKNIEATTNDFSKYRSDADAVIENLSLQQNINNVNKYISEGKTGDADFDNRVAMAIELYTQGLEWIKQIKHS